MINNIKYELSALGANSFDRINKIYMIFLVFLYPDYPVYPVKKKKSLIIKNNKGFTLIEIIIVIIVLAILSIFGFHFLSTGIHTYSMMEKQKGLFDQATMVMERISRELRDAKIITTATGSTLTFTKSHGTLEETTTYVITFQCPSTTLQRIGSTTPATVNLADNVTAFTVTNSSNEITISLTLESGGASITLRSYIYPKNLPFTNPAAPSGRNFGGSWEEDIE
ncbi:MAG: prepilin-type N-terminal cleavage/methylation domain-containing protein [Proteobacteria bacterium]|nr:prepilin-type N-terminal cleavage/methylation domain-containing protein [Pseudomonadota bacterium]